MGLESQHEIMETDYANYKDEKPSDTKMIFTSFDKNSYDSGKITDFDEIEIQNGKVNWLDIVGLKDRETILSIQEYFKIHPLAIEDILSLDQRTKAESYDDFLFVVTDVGVYSKLDDEDEIEFSQISFILKRDLLITVQEKPSKLFKGINNKIRDVNQFRHKSCDALLFTLIDRIVDHYFVIIDEIGEDIDDLEDELIDEEDDSTLNKLYMVKKNLIYLKKKLGPLRSVINSISKSKFSVMDESTVYYFRDVYDHVIQMIDFIEIYRDMTTSMIESYRTNISNKTNDVMKVLTVWSTIFLPLTFMTGVYGMNFKFMPELSQEYGYVAFWVMAAVIVSGMIYYFKKKDWI